MPPQKTETGLRSFRNWYEVIVYIPSLSFPITTNHKYPKRHFVSSLDRFPSQAIVGSEFFPSPRPWKRQSLAARLKCFARGSFSGYLCWPAHISGRAKFLFTKLLCVLTAFSIRLLNLSKDRSSAVHRVLSLVLHSSAFQKNVHRDISCSKG